VNILLAELFEDINGNLDPTSFALNSVPNDLSSMVVVDDYEIKIDLSENTFVGTTEFTVSVCDESGSCVEKTYSITIEGEEPGELVIYNAVSPNGDGNNDFMEITSIDQYPDNHLVVFDRWGNKVFEVESYDNNTRKFEGMGNVGSKGKLPTGTYYYQLSIEELSKVFRGFIVLKN